MKQPIQYTLVDRDSAVQLVKAVNELLAEGSWHLHGSPQVAADPQGYYTFAQALVRYAEEGGK